MEDQALAEQAEEFFTDVWTVIDTVLPTFGVEPDIRMNEDSGLVSAEFKIPLAFGGPAITKGDDPVPDSDLFTAVIVYDMGRDRTEKHLTVHKSKYEIRVHTAPGIRFEYERHKKSVPAAHIHFTGVGGLLSPALMRNHTTGKAKKGDLQNLHLPVGGHRFRPSLEDFLFFVIGECGFRPKAGWENYLLQHREQWMDKQLTAAVRDNPAVAREVLESLGYSIASPSGGEPKARRHSGW